MKSIFYVRLRFYLDISNRSRYTSALFLKLVVVVIFPLELQCIYLANEDETVTDPPDPFKIAL